MNIGTHRNPHGDELCAIAVARRFDPEFQNAQVLTFGSAEEANAAAKAGNLLLIGIGEGKFDEHRKNDQECAATLVARHLKIDDLMFFRLFEEVRSCDLLAKSRRTHISEILKVLYDHLPENEVIAWGLKAYDTLISLSEAGNYKPANTDILEEVAVNLGSEFAGTGKSLASKNAWLDCQAAVKNSRDGLTELRTVTDGLALASREEAQRWAEVGIRALFHRQHDFEKALELVSKGYRFIANWSCYQGSFRKAGSYKCVGIISDNAQSSRAFRSNRAGNYDILVVRNQSGHVQIFTNHKANIPMIHCAKAIRHAEAKKRNIIVNLDELGEDGNCKQVPQWHLFAKGAMLMNGSKSHPGIEKTVLTDREIILVIQDAFLQARESELRNTVLR